MRYYNLFKIITLLFTLLIISPTLIIAGQYKVIRVVDGDTIVIRYNGKYEKVRLLCVNTPESVHPDKKQNIPMGKAASKYTQKKLIGKSVDLEFAPKVIAFNKKSVELTGNAKEQFMQWRIFLQKIYSEEKTPDVQL